MPEEQIVLLAINGLRKKGGGKHYIPRPKAVRSEQPAQVFRVERARYASTENAFRRYSQRQLDLYLRGDVTERTFLKEYSHELYRYQTKVFMLGRRSAGRIDSALTDADRKYLHGQHSQEMKFFHNFVKDMRTHSGRMDYRHRMDLYALSGHSLYIRGSVQAMPEVARWLWIVNILAEHCEDCLARERLSREQQGFTVEELETTIGYPGERTRCGNRCRCTLRGRRAKFQIPRTRPTAFKHLERITQ